jgi:NADPH:quinone reductase-like Zn-dependent oxidoreductase
VHFPIPVYSQQEAQVLKQLVEDGTYRPLIDRIYPMDEIVAAARYVDTGEKVGNVVVQVATGPGM